MMGNSMLDRLRARPAGGATVLFPRTAFPLHAMVTSAGYDRCTDPGYDWHGLRRGDAPFVLLQHTLSGRGRLRFEGRRVQIQEGQTMLLRFPHDNRYWLGPHAQWEFFWLCLNGREVLRVWREVMAVHGPLVCLPACTLDRLAGICLSVLDGAASTAARSSSLAYEAAMCVADELLPRADRAAAARPVAIERSVSLCHARASDPRLDVAQLAAAAGYSRHHFTRLFTQSVGSPPARYLLHLRLEKAVGQLRSSNLPVKQVAARCGFADPNYFAKAFRRVFGINPRDVRRSGAFGGRTSRSAFAQDTRLC
jgi:AraC family transcriptional regulator